MLGYQTYQSSAQDSNHRMVHAVVPVPRDLQRVSIYNAQAKANDPSDLPLHYARYADFGVSTASSR